MYSSFSAKLSVGWDQAFLRSFEVSASQPLACIPTELTEMLELSELLDLRTEEESYLSRLWSLHCAGWVAPARQTTGCCIGLHEDSVALLRSQASTELSDLVWLRLVDVLASPVDERTAFALSANRRQLSLTSVPGDFSVWQHLPPVKSQPTLGLAMIAKNEASRLEQCLSSLSPVVDQIVIVDTGSTDGTPQLAESLGALVLNVPWQEDFAAARNVAIETIDTDWILILDADEEIAFSDFHKLKELMVRPGAQAYELEARNYYRSHNNLAEWIPNDGLYPESSGYPGWVPSYSIRLFRKDAGLCYQGRIHELLDYSLWQMLLPKSSANIPVHHYGCLEPANKAGKADRYVRMARKKVEEFGLARGKALWELGVLLGEAGQYPEAVECYLESIRNNRLYLPSYLSLLSPLLRLGAFLAAREVCFYLSEVIKSTLVVKTTLHIQELMRQHGRGNTALLSTITSTIGTAPWKAYRVISEQSQLWNQKEDLMRNLSNAEKTLERIA